MTRLPITDKEQRNQSPTLWKKIESTRAFHAQSATLKTLLKFSLCHYLIQSHIKLDMKWHAQQVQLNRKWVDWIPKECWALLINICPWFFHITTGVRGSPHPCLILVWMVLIISVQQSMKYVLFTDLDFILEYTEILSSQCYWQKFTMAPRLSTAILYTKNITIQNSFHLWWEKLCWGLVPYHTRWIK